MFIYVLLSRCFFLLPVNFQTFSVFSMSVPGWLFFEQYYYIDIYNQCVSHWWKCHGSSFTIDKVKMASKALSCHTNDTVAHQFAKYLYIRCKWDLYVKWALMKYLFPTAYTSWTIDYFYLFLQFDHPSIIRLCFGVSVWNRDR